MDKQKALLYFKKCAECKIPESISLSLFLHKIGLKKTAMHILNEKRAEEDALKKQKEMQALSNWALGGGLSGGALGYTLGEYMYPALLDNDAKILGALSGATGGAILGSYAKSLLKD